MIVIDLNGIRNLTEVEFPKKIEYDLRLKNLATDTIGLVLPEEVEGLSIDNISGKNDITFPKKIDGFLMINKMENAKELILSTEEVNDDLYIEYPKVIDKVVLPEIVYGEIDKFKWLSNTRFVEEFHFPKKAKGNIYLNKLEFAKRIILPETLDGDIHIPFLREIDKIICPNEITGTIHLGTNISKYDEKLKVHDKIQFPEKFKGNIHIENLEDGETLLLPAEMEGNLDLRYLNSNHNLDLPKYVKGELFLVDTEISQNLMFPQGITKLHISILLKDKKLVLPESLKDIEVIASSSVSYISDDEYYSIRDEKGNCFQKKK